MLQLLFNGNFALFGIIIIALILSLSFHEWGHAFSAWCFGDDTAARMGRLTLNPAAHIDALGLLMVVMVGFGYAKPVPVNPNNFRHKWADFWVAAAGPAMNLVLGFMAINLLAIGHRWQLDWMLGRGPTQFLLYLGVINMALMLFNLIPLGPLDGRYLLPYFLPRRAARHYEWFNERYGTMALLGLMLLSFVGVPVFGIVFGLGQRMLGWLQVI